MKERTDLMDVGAIVGRFQVPELHDAHKALIEFVCDRHSNVLVFLGKSVALGTRSNPLDFRSRQQMLSEAFPELSVHYINDQPTDRAWSKDLDRMVSDLLLPQQTVALYGGRESFIAKYQGKFPVVELVSERYFNSGTEVRRQIAKGKADPTVGFRRGQVYAAHARFPTAYTAVDIAIFSGDDDRILLGKRDTEDAWRLPGGFVEPPPPGKRRGQALIEPTARRETKEEVGVDITDPVIVGSFVQDDWRYRSEVDCVYSLLVKAHYLSGQVRPGDDIDQAQWWEVETIKPSDVVPEHHHLLDAVLPVAAKAWSAAYTEATT